MNNFDNISQQQVQEAARSLINFIRGFVDEHKDEFKQVYTEEPHKRGR